jgi:hypothetical protein
MNMTKIWGLLAMTLVLVFMPLESDAQSMDEINAGIRARAAAAKGQEPQELHISLTNGTTSDGGNSAKRAQWESIADHTCEVSSWSAETCATYKLGNPYRTQAEHDQFSDQLSRERAQSTAKYLAASRARRAEGLADLEEFHKKTQQRMDRTR